MKFVLFDIDGTLADSTHRNVKLPAYTGKAVMRIADETPGVVFNRFEVDGHPETWVTVRWLLDGTKEGRHEDKAYPWREFMEVTGQSFILWHTEMYKDAPIDFTCWLLRSMRPALLAEGKSVFFLTSRWNAFRGDTHDWLLHNGLTAPGYCDILEMRPDNDERKDTEYKGSVLDRYEDDGHEFLMAFEDRRAVCSYLRGRNIPALHVADYE